MLGFKRFVTARRTIAGVEAMVMLRKGQVLTAQPTICQCSELSSQTSSAWLLDRRRSWARPSQSRSMQQNPRDNVIVTRLHAALLLSLFARTTSAPPKIAFRFQYRLSHSITFRKGVPARYAPRFSQTNPHVSRQAPRPWSACPPRRPPIPTIHSLRPCSTTLTLGPLRQPRAARMSSAWRWRTSSQSHHSPYVDPGDSRSQAVSYLA